MYQHKGPRLHFNPFSPLKLLSESKFQSKDQVVELVIKADIEALSNCKVDQAEGQASRVFKENVLGKLLVAGSKLKFERAQLEQWRQNQSTDDSRGEGGRPMAGKITNYSLPLNNSRPAPSTDPVVVESQSRGDLKVDHQPLLVHKSLTRKLSRVEGVHWRGLFDYVDPVEMNSGFRLMGQSKAETGMGHGIIASVIEKQEFQMEGSAKVESKGSEPSKAINRSGEVLRLLMKGMDVADGGLRLNIGQSEDWNLTAYGVHELVKTLHLEDGGGGGAAEDRASLCDLFDGLWKPGGQE
ncbi:hypothetical protein PPACK8108_LOCUS24028 [Phakopsora pachyrhizi]|uniref:Uncharacterized protein n=1 Tax=Phakopsora pachyrhizi TaxID=170000 RepID=A0AAV0BPL6_PHAPC|nr:hypothetical protein PPACK8108_LOCUS24028 [Phakopsora pachyrhizi]